MKILIQDKLTGFYRKEAGSWGREADTAIDFANTSLAERFCRDHQLRNVQVVLKFARLQGDIHLAIDEQRLSQHPA